MRSGILGICAFVLCLFITVDPAYAAPSNSVTIRDLSGSAQTNRPFTISRVFAQGEISSCAQARVGGTPVPTQCDVKTRWADGSVQHALLSFHANLTSNGSVTVDFVNTTAATNSGAMDRAAMLAANWGAAIELTNGSKLVADARKIVSDWTGTASDTKVTYWLRGPICTQVILEDRTPALTYDMGWDTYKSLHPIFVVTFYPGAPSSTKVEMIVENMWSTKRQDQSYSFALRTGNPLSATPHSKATFTHYAGTRWRKEAWSGTAPGAVAIDHNLAYMTYSKILPNFDLSKVVPQSAVDGDVSRFSSSDKGDINGSAMWLKYMPQTGGRDDIGLFPAFYVRYLYTFNPQLEQVVSGNAAVASYVPVHFRESDTTMKYDAAGSVAAFGRSRSVHARVSGSPAAVGTDSNGSGWTVDIAHLGSFVFVPYLLTGNWYYLEEMYQFASWIVSAADPTVNHWGRHGDWGIIPFALQTRGVAWGMRELGHATVMAPDGSPEKAYFRDKMNNNIAMREGEHNVTDGQFYDPSTTSKWYWGRNTVGEGASNPLHFLNRGDEYAAKEGLDTAQVMWPDSPWQYGYTHIVFGHLNELGFPVAKVQQAYLKNLLHQLQNPAYNPYLAAAYRVPVRQTSKDTYFQTWTEVRNAYTPAMQNVTTWPSGDEGDINHGYPHIVRAAASFLPGFNDGGLSGQAAWNWISANVGYQNLVGSNPRWALLPRSQTSAPPPSNPVVSKCDLNNDSKVDVADVQVSINASLAISPCSGSDLDGDSQCTVIDVQRVVNAAIGGACRTGP